MLLLVFRRRRVTRTSCRAGQQAIGCVVDTVKVIVSGCLTVDGDVKRRENGWNGKTMMEFGHGTERGMRVNCFE